MRLKDKVAIVTGGGSGIGHQSCLQFAREGARVLVVDILADKAKQVARQITEKGGVAEASAEDVSSEEGAKRIASRATDLWKRVDILVNNAASFHHKTVEEATAADWETVLKVNVLGTSFCTKYAVPFMKQQGSGSIINVASINGLVAMPTGWTNYSASKAAIVNMSKSMAYDFAPFGIRVNCLCPGMIHTPAMEDLLKTMNMTRKQAEDQFLGPRCMLKRFGEAHEIAAIILTMASDEASYMTGATIVVDGGYTS
jgi:NAD(P)-dependent dehydrogenase (short-subunit alcohol dehydrogenase family)